MADENTKRIFDLEDETDFLTTYLMSDKAGRPAALKAPLSAFALKTETNIQEIPDVNYKDLDYSGWGALQGFFFLSSLGSDLVNAPFTPMPANTYLITALVNNFSSKIHKISYWVQSSGSDFNSKIRQFVRMGTNLANAITAGFTEFTISPFAYVSGIQQVQDTSDVTVNNDTDDYLDSGLGITITELNSGSAFRFDVSLYTQGVLPNSKVQYRLLENGAELYESPILEIGNDTISNSFVVVIDSHSPVNPSTFTVEFKNIDGQVNLLGGEKPLSMVLTEIYQTTR